MARRSAARASEESASAAWRAAGDAARRQREAARNAPAEGAARWEPEEWIDEGAVRDEAEDAVTRARRRPKKASSPGGEAAGGWTPSPLAPDDVAEATAVTAPARSGDLASEIRAAVGAARAARFEARMREAVDAIRRGRDEEARRIVRGLANTAPTVAAVRELYGLALYRLGRWKLAIEQLEAFRQLSGSVEQHPMLADSYRAVGRYGKVDELWQELRAVSPGAPLVAEGRIVAAGALADQGRVEEAIRLLEPGVAPARKAKEHHLRMAYALADLYERAGDLPRARELFQRVATAAPDFVDVDARIHALR